MRGGTPGRPGPTTLVRDTSDTDSGCGRRRWGTTGRCGEEGGVRPWLRGDLPSPVPPTPVSFFDDSFLESERTRTQSPQLRCAGGPLHHTPEEKGVSVPRRA